MKRIAILTAGGDTPALNATIHGAVTRANQRKVEVLGLIRGFSSLYDQRVPHVRLNPLFGEIPELDPTKGGSLLGASRKYVGQDDPAELDRICERLRKLNVEGLICVGGDGTMNGLQPLCDLMPTVLAPKTIDNDLGLNYEHEPDKWDRVSDPAAPEGFRYTVRPSEQAHSPQHFNLENMINYVTPGFATAVFVSAGGVRRVRTTAESHRRIAIIEVMGRHSGFLAIGTAYGQPDLILVPEVRIDIERLTRRVKELYDLQGHVVLVCGEGIRDESGNPLGAPHPSTDPAGNLLLSGAAESLRERLMESIGDGFFRQTGHQNSAGRAIFTRKVGHTQRGGRPLRFDRFHAAQLGGKAVEMLLEGENNTVATLRWIHDHGFEMASFSGNSFRDRWGVIHARTLHASFYDAERMQIGSAGIEYLLPIFTNAIGHDDMEYLRETLFDSGNLFRRYHSVNTDIEKRTQYLE